MKYRLNEPALERTLALFPNLDRDYVLDAIFRCLDGRGPDSYEQELVWLAYYDECSSVDETDEDWD